MLLNLFRRRFSKIEIEENSLSIVLDVGMNPRRLFSIAASIGN